MFPTWEVELVRSIYSSSSRPSSTRAIRHSSPSETLINSSFATLFVVLCQSVCCQWFVAGGFVCSSQWASRIVAAFARQAGIITTDHELLTTNSLTGLKSLWNDLPRFLAQKMHNLPFAIKTHDA